MFNFFSRTASALLIAIAIILVAWAFTRVANRPDHHAQIEGQETLTLMHWSGDAGQEEDAIVADLIADFEADNPGTRIRRINPGDAGSFYTKLQTMMAAGSPPDVFYVGAERLPAFASMGLLAPTPESDFNLTDFYPATVNAFRFNGTRAGRGTLYGVPKDFTTLGFYINLDLFQQAGIQVPTTSWTWQEFLDAALAIGQIENCTGAEFVTWPMMVRLFLRTHNLDVVSPDFEQLRFREPAVMATLQKLRDWRHDRTAYPNALTSGKSKVASGSSVFLTGKIGMAGPFGRWVVPSYRKTNFRWDFAPLPHAKGLAPANAIATVAWSVAAASPRQAASWALVRHLTGEKSQRLAAPLGLAIPTRISIAESSAFIDPAQAPANDRAFLDQANNASVIAWPADARFEAIFQARMDQGLKTGDQTLEQAVATFEKDWSLVKNSPLAKEDWPLVNWARISLWGSLTLIALLTALAIRWWRTRPGALEWKEELWGWALLSPWLLGFIFFLALPIALSLVLSFSKWNGVSTLDHAQFVGLNNYTQLLAHDDRFLTSLRVTLYYALLAVPLGQVMALGAAMLMNSKVRGIGFFRAAWYLPSVLAGVGIAVLWRWVFDGDHGLMNAGLQPILDSPILSWANLTAPEWFGADAAWFGPPAFALMSLWAVGGPMMIYLAGLQGIPQSLHEAAELDGAGRWAKFRHVTLPMLSPVIFFNTIMAVIGSFQVFTQAFVMTGGEPGDLTRFYVLYLYNQAFEFHEMGYASAMAWLLLIIILALTVIMMRGSKRFVHYESLSS
ncbi:MAG: extracellular solute-binding protein [Planctomycetes bacterium]|nr:extracellular solute-binding protein [Planctomycetota bacterium]MBT4027856.1 extracellular solute-binding protein [Planctomycetota bacterium]MBT4559349.1 extracellular solute-binding protein [Planctomycetota bacterium]MBT5120013.1 extracellular solute-binding protein [Planctomycetota bacterium]MBT7011395.1 extracellular solute-binding protein [Planctomycetota bacterium]